MDEFYANLNLLLAPFYRLRHDKECDNVERAIALLVEHAADIHDPFFVDLQMRSIARRRGPTIRRLFIRHLLGAVIVVGHVRLVGGGLLWAEQTAPLSGSQAIAAFLYPELEEALRPRPICYYQDAAVSWEWGRHQRVLCRAVGHLLTHMPAVVVQLTTTSDGYLRHTTRRIYVHDSWPLVGFRDGTHESVFLTSAEDVVAFLTAD